MFDDATTYRCVLAAATRLDAMVLKLMLDGMQGLAGLDSSL